jgi:hypothetical protein
MKKIIICLCFSLGYLSASGQGKVSYNYDQRAYNPYLSRFSYTVSLGFSAYNGELSTFFKPSQQNYYLNPGLGIGAAYRINDHLSVRGEVNGFSLYAESAQIDEKNQSFLGINMDFYLNAVVDLFPKGKIDGRFHRWDAHVFAGYGYMAFFPNSSETDDNRTGVVFVDSATSNYEFKRFTSIFPVGAGVKYYVDKNHYFSMEGNYRFTYTDFLDATKDLTNDTYDKYFTLFFKFTVIVDRNPRKSFDYSRYIRNRKKNRRE